MSIKDKITQAVRSMTSEAANEDAPANVDVPPPDGGPVEMDREPMAGHEPEPDPDPEEPDA